MTVPSPELKHEFRRPMQRRELQRRDQIICDSVGTALRQAFISSATARTKAIGMSNNDKRAGQLVRSRSLGGYILGKYVERCTAIGIQR